MFCKLNSNPCNEQLEAFKDKRGNTNYMNPNYNKMLYNYFFKLFFIHRKKNNCSTILAVATIFKKENGGA